MNNPRVENLARILVEHSAGVKPGDVCTVEGGSAAEPLLQAVYEQVLRAGGNPIVQMAMEEQAPAFFEHASDEQLQWVSPTSEWVVENADVRIAVMASQNTRALSEVPPERQTMMQAARQHLMARMMERSAEGILPLGADPVPDPRLRLRGGHEPDRLRGLLLRRLPGDGERPGGRPGSASPRRPSACGSGSRAAPRST